MEDVGVDGNKLLKGMLKKWNARLWTYSSGSYSAATAGTSAHRKEPSGSISARDFSTS